MTARQVCFQVADAGLLDADLTRAIRRHEDFDPNEVVAALVFTARDLYAGAKNDSQATVAEKLSATASLVTAFLSALVLAKSVK